MVLDKLGESLRNTLQKITKSTFVDEKLVNELVKDIQRALLQADVNVQLVLKLSQSIKEKALKEKPPGAMSHKEWLIKIVYDELVQFLGGEDTKLDVSKGTRLMLVGLFGSGKTTAAGKLGRYYAKRGFKVCLVGLDVHRPAAPEQLAQVGKAADVAVFIDKQQKDPIKILEKFEPEFKKYDLIIADTAGRDALSEDLIEELGNIHKRFKPNESLLVISADIGQAAERQAAKFHETCNVTGVIVTKLEGTAKGGGALSACAVTDANVKFIGTGEKVQDLEEFHPQRFVGKMLGMGDLQGLLEKAQEVMTEEQAEDLGKRFLKGKFNLLDLYEQMEAMKSMGPLNKLVDMIPGFSSLKLPKEVLEVQQGKLKTWRYVMDSMTKEELGDPEIITSSRIDRIAKGAGSRPQEIRELLKQFKQSKKMVKMFKGAGSPKQMEKMMKRFQGNVPKM